MLTEKRKTITSPIDCLDMTGMSHRKVLLAEEGAAQFLCCMDNLTEE